MGLIHLVRHGEPAASWGEAADPGLSALGHRQALDTASRLAGAAPPLLVTSPLARCRQTAAPLEQALGMAARIEPRVAEIAVPAGTGDPRGWLTGLLEGSWEASGLAPWRAAVMAALSDLPDGTVVFSHFIAINAAVSAALGRGEVTVFRPGHATVTTLAREDGRLAVVELGSEAAVRLA